MAITEDHITAIGRITVNHSNLDMTLTMFLFGLVNPDWRIARTVIGECTYQQKLDVAARLVPIVLKSERLQREFKVLFPRLEKAGQDRNAVAHASWMSDEPDEPTLVVSQVNWIRGKKVSDPRARMRPRSAAQLETIAEEIADTLTKLMNIYQRAGLAKTSDPLPSGVEASDVRSALGRE